MKNHMTSKYQQLLQLLGEVDDLQRACSILSWEKHTYMPAQGARWRSVQMTSLTKLAHERFTSPKLGKLIDTLLPWAEEVEDSPQVRIIKTAARDYHKAIRLPLSFVEEKAAVVNEAYFGWLKAREENSFKVYVTHLERLVENHIKQAHLLGFTDHVLDPLIDEMEGGFGTKEIEGIFRDVRQVLQTVINRINHTDKALPLDYLLQEFPRADQLRAAKEGLRKIGFDFTRGRVDEVVHPFCSCFSPDDVRVTTRIVKGNPTACFFSCLHEGGHGLYDLGMPAVYFRTPVYRGASSGIHESQSRLWENIIGRSRDYWNSFYKTFQGIFTNQLNGVSQNQWYQAINRVQPSYIRVEADEVSYNLHIILRFELEKAVMDNKLRVSELEDAYNAKIKEFFDLPAPDPINGVIQDIHWTEYFGTSYQGYTIGNIASVQFLEAAKRTSPEIASQLKNADYSGLHSWLEEKVHVHGSYYRPQELLRVVTGKPLDATEYLDYIKTKYGDLYHLNLEAI